MLLGPARAAVATAVLKTPSAAASSVATAAAAAHAAD